MPFSIQNKGRRGIIWNLRTEVTLFCLQLVSPRCMWSLMMGVWQPMTNLRDYVSQNPPGVTFFLCLLSLAVSFICLSSYSFANTLPNPDTATVRILSCVQRNPDCIYACDYGNTDVEIIHVIPPSGLEPYPVLLITVPAVCESQRKFVWACLACPLSCDRQRHFSWVHSEFLCHQFASQGSSDCDYQLRQWLFERP